MAVLTDEELDFQVDENGETDLGAEVDLQLDFIPDGTEPISAEESIDNFNKAWDFAVDLQIPLQDAENNFADIELVESGAFDPSEPPQIREPISYDPPPLPSFELDAESIRVSNQIRQRKVDTLKEFFAVEPEKQESIAERMKAALLATPLAKIAGVEQPTESLIQKQRIVSLSDVDLQFVSDVLIDNINEFDKKIRNSVQKEIRVRQFISALKGAPEVKQTEMIILVRGANLFNLPEFTSRLGINVFEGGVGGRKGDMDAAIEAATRVLAEKNEIDPVNATRIVDLGVGVMKTALEFWLTPGAKLANAPAALRPLLQTGAKFAAHEALQAPAEGETLRDRSLSVTESALIGFGVGGAGKLIPKAAVRVPTVVGGFSALTFARTGDLEASIETGVTVLGFEALGLMQKTTRLTGSKIRNTFANKAVRAARAHNPDLFRLTNKEVGQILQKQVENWQQIGLERTIGDKAKRREADNALRLKKHGDPSAWNELVVRQGFGQAAREQAGIAPEAARAATGKPVAALRPGTQPVTPPVAAKPSGPVITGAEGAAALGAAQPPTAKPAIPLEAKPPPEFTLRDIRELPKKTTKAQTEVFEQQTTQPIDRTSDSALSETETRVSLVKAMSPKAQDEIETQSVAKVRDRISFKKPKVAIRQRFKNLLFKADKAFRDEFAGLRRVVKAADVGDLAPADDPVQLAVAFTQKASAKTRGFVLESTTDLAGNRKSKGLKQIFAPIIKDGGKAKFEEFVTYLVAARDINLQKRNIETGIDPVASRLTFDALDSPEFAQAAREITEWNQKGIDLLVESGRITKESGDAIKLANPIYAPFFREFAEEEMGVTTRKGKKFVPRKLKGSKRKIVDPVEGMIQQMQATIESAQRAAIERSIANLATKNPEALEDFIKPTRPPVVPTKFTVKEIQAELEEIGIDFTGVAKEDLNELLTVFRPSAFPATQGVIKLKVDGKNKFFKAEKELLEVLDGVEVYKLGPFWDIVAGKPTRLLKLGATGLNPAFGVIRNPIRDIQTFTVTSEFAKAGPFSAVSGILKDVKTKASGIAENFGFNSFEKSSDVTKFAALGGEMSGFITQDRAGTRHIQHEMLASNGVRYTVNTFRHPLDALRSLIGITEIGTRVGEFSAALKEGERLYGKGSLSASVFGVNAAQDVTTNFTRHGQIGKQINQIIPFFNVAIQGPDKIIRSFKDRPFKSTVAAVSTLTIPAIFFWWRNKDKPWYQNMTAHEKANYIHFESPDDEDVIFRFPVAFELGHVFQAIPVAFLDAVHNNNPEEVKDILEATLNTANPLDWPSLIGPIIDIKANEDFAGRPIVSRANEGKLPADQFGPNTTELMKVIGRAINMSPSQIEHLTNSYTGGIYNRVARILESNDVEKQPADMPVIGTLFVRDPFAPRRQVQEFYTERKLLNQKFQSGTITLQEAFRRIAINNFATVLSVSFDALREAKTVERRKKIWSDIGRIVSFTDTVAPKRNREAQIPKE